MVEYLVANKRNPSVPFEPPRNTERRFPIASGEIEEIQKSKDEVVRVRFPLRAFFKYSSTIIIMKKEYKEKGNYAEDFLDYLDKSLIKKGLAKEVRHLRGGVGGYKAGIGPGPDADGGSSSVYRLSENPEVGLRILTQKDFGYNQNPKEWAFVRTFLIPWKEVKGIKDNSESELTGEEIKDGSYMATSDREFKAYKTFEELENEILGDFNKNNSKRNNQKSLDKLFSIGLASLFLIGMLFVSHSITGNAIRQFDFTGRNFIGLFLIILSIIGLFFKFNITKNKTKDKLKKLEKI